MSTFPLPANASTVPATGFTPAAYRDAATATALRAQRAEAQSPYGGMVVAFMSSAMLQNIVADLGPVPTLPGGVTIGSETTWVVESPVPFYAALFIEAKVQQDA